MELLSWNCVAPRRSELAAVVSQCTTSLAAIPSLASSVARTYACASVMEEIRNENAPMSFIIVSCSCRLLVRASWPRASKDRCQLGQDRTNLTDFTDLAGGRQSAFASWNDS